MVPTPIGFILIPLGLLCFFWRPAWLYALLVFFAPFSATSVINSGGGDSGSGLQPSIYFSVLLVLRSLLDFALALEVRFAKNLRRPLILLAGFGIACLISLIMPIVAAGKIEVMSAGLLTAPLEPLHFKSTNITWLVAVLLGIWLVAYIGQKNLRPDQFFKTLRIYLASGAFICCWGILQFLLYLVHIPYPSAVFNNSASPYALGYDKPLGSLDIVRVSSVALEPSVLAIVIVGMLPIVAIAVFGRSRIFGKFRDRALLALLLITLILTTSSIGYVSVAVMGSLLLFTLVRYHSLSTGRMLAILSPVILAALGFVVSSSVRGIVQEVLLGKSDSWSALERGTVVLNDVGYFRQYPILGLGWGSAPAHDLTMGILANSGIIGLGAFLSFVLYLLWTLHRRAAEAYLTRQPYNPPHIMLLVLVTTLTAFFISSVPGGPVFWLVVGLSVAAGRLPMDNSSTARVVG